MKKSISIEKEIRFPTMIGEVSAISLEQNLYFLDECNIRGDFLLNGKYKLTEASRLEEDFNYKIPVEITLGERISLNTTNIEITDFAYEIRGDCLICHIEILIEGMETTITENNNDSFKQEIRECDDDLQISKEIEIPSIEPKKAKEKVIETEDNSSDINIEENAYLEDDKKVNEKESSLFINLKDDDDSYGTFIVYIVRRDESINSIIEKYHTTIEEIEKYNDISNIDIGTKLIIPITND